MSWLHQGLDFLRHLSDHLNSMADHLGPWTYVVLFLIVFCETGLVVTPFLPGDSLLLALGAVAASGHAINLPLAIVILCIAANCGDLVNYFLGYTIGPKVFSKQTSWLLNRKHLDEAQAFYDRHGRMTIILARFVPIIRTFAPFVAGIGKMKLTRFATFSITGGAFWVTSVSLAGYFFGNIQVVKKNFELVILAVIAVSVLPAVIHAMKSRGKAETVNTPVEPG